ncbi:MAG: COG2426 family protein [Christensenellales bacterium]
MTEFIEQLFHNIFGNNVWLATILIAVIPAIELKGAIPFSMSRQIWGSEALGLFEGFFAGFLGSSMIVPVLVLLYKPIINFLKKTKFFRKLASKIEGRVDKKKQKIEDDIELQYLAENGGNVRILNAITDGQKEENLSQNNNTGSVSAIKNEPLENQNDKATFSLKKKIISIFIFVALPFPFTGVWTGACIAVALGLNFWQSTATVILGNAVAGLIVMLVSALFGDATIIFMYIFLAMIVSGLLFFATRAIVRMIKKRRKNA